MIKVECFSQYGLAGNAKDWHTPDMASSFIRLMMDYDWVTHFVVTGPDWKVIVRRRVRG